MQCNTSAQWKALFFGSSHVTIKKIGYFLEVVEGIILTRVIYVSCDVDSTHCVKPLFDTRKSDGNGFVLKEITWDMARCVTFITSYMFYNCEDYKFGKIFHKQRAFVI